MEEIRISPSPRRGGLRRAFLEAAVPFAQGRMPQALAAVHDERGSAVPLQSTVLATWPDGSVKWLHVTCDTRRAAGALLLTPGAEGTSEPHPPLAVDDGDAVEVDTGAVRWRMPRTIPLPLDECVHGVLTGLAARRGGRTRELTGHSQHSGFFVKDAEGTVYGSARARDTTEIRIHESGPLRATVLISARPARSVHQRFLWCRMRLQAWRGSSVVRLVITWLNRDERHPAFIRDIRFRLPLAYRAERAVLGCEFGPCEVRITGQEEAYVLQDDEDRYWAMQTGWGAEDIDLASGGASGRRAPGWAMASGEGCSVGVFVPRFPQEYPNEIAIRAQEISVGLWPERANAVIPRRHRVLPRGPAENPYGRGSYDSIMVQPYWAYFSQQRECLEAVPGLAKTQEIVFDFAPPAAERFGLAAERGFLEPDRGVVDPRHVARTGVFGPALPPGNPELARADEMLARVFSWFRRHMDGGWTWGKFDYGDLRYIVYTPQSRMSPAYRGTERGPRAGYWNNNENDPVQGLLAHFYLTGDRDAWRLGRAAARHLLDVDMHHGEGVGFYQHGFGHTFRRGGYRSMDHLWADGAWTSYFSEGDWFDRQDLEALRAMAMAEISTKPFAEDNLRNFVLGITMNVGFFNSTHDRAHLDAALAAARDLIRHQAAEGYFPAAGPTWREQHRESEAFPGEFSGPSILSELHAMEALHRLHEATDAEDIGTSFVRLMRWFVTCGLYPARDAVRRLVMPRGEENPRGAGLFVSGNFFAFPALEYAYRITRDRQFAAVGARMLRHLADTQMRSGRHPLARDIWFEHAEVAQAGEQETVPQRFSDPDAVFNYLTPLSASFALYKTRGIMWAIQEAGTTAELNRTIRKDRRDRDPVQPSSC